MCGKYNEFINEIYFVIHFEVNRLNNGNKLYDP